MILLKLLKIIKDGSMFDMTLSLNTLAYDAFELARGVISDDDTIDYRQIKFWITTQRALWLRNEFNKNRTIDEGFIQDLGCIEMEDVDASQCCNITTGCTVKRSVLVIPQTIERYNEPTITSIGPVNPMEKRWRLVPYSNVPFVGKGRFNRKMVYPFIFNKHIHLVFASDNQDAKLIKYISARGVFEDPTAVRNFATCSGTTCYTDDDRYPINAWLWDYMKSQIIKSNLRYEMFASSDTSANAASDTPYTDTQSTGIVNTMKSE
jgi:hypothetical protein